MTDSTQNPGGLTAPRRNHYFSGKMMGVTQFEREQSYNIDQRRLMNRLSLGTGILCGLELGASSDSTKIFVQPGVAVDGLGREIVVPCCTEYDIRKPPSDCCCGAQQPVKAPGTYAVCLSYCECRTDPKRVEENDGCSGQFDCDHDTTVETFTLSLIPVREAPRPPRFDCEEWLATEPADVPAVIEAPPAAEPEPKPVGVALNPERLNAALPPQLREADSRRLDVHGMGQIPGPGADGTTRPPNIDEIAERLASMLKSGGCPSSPNPCVVLGEVNLVREKNPVFEQKGEAGLLVLKAPPRSKGRTYLYSQQQLLDMILCLASRIVKCCGQEPSTSPQPQPETLKVTGFEVGVGTWGKSGLQYCSLPLVSSSPAPTYRVPAALMFRGSLLVLKITFNQPVDPSSLPLAAETHPSSVALGFVKVGDEVEFAEVRPAATLEEPNVLLLSLDIKQLQWESDAQFSLEFAFTLYGDDDSASPPRHSALRAYSTVPGQGQRLDGDMNGSEGGKYQHEFDVQFTIDDRHRQMQLVGAAASTRALSAIISAGACEWLQLYWPRLLINITCIWLASASGIVVLLRFNRSVAENTLTDGIQVSVSTAQGPLDQSVLTVDKTLLEFGGIVAIQVQLDTTPDSPEAPIEPPTSLTVTLNGATLTATDGEPYNMGDDFTFTIQIVPST